MKKFLYILLFTLFLGVSGKALEVKTYLEQRNGSSEQQSYLKVYVTGLWQGYFWYRVNHKVVGKGKEFGKNNPTVFCPPPDGKIRGEPLEFIDAEILYQKQQGTLDETFLIEIILGQYLNRTFPCE